MGKAMKMRAAATASKLSMIDRLMLPRLQQYAINYRLCDVDSAVEYLRTNYREYKRYKHQPFRSAVQRALKHIKSQPTTTNNGFQDDDDDDDEGNEECCQSPCKRPRIEPSSKKRLQRRDAAYIQNKNQRIISGSEETDETMSQDDDDDDYEIDTPRPFSDLMNSLIRADYGKPNKQNNNDNSSYNVNNETEEISSNSETKNPPKAVPETETPRKLSPGARNPRNPKAGTRYPQNPRAQTRNPPTPTIADKSNSGVTVERNIETDAKTPKSLKGNSPVQMSKSSAFDDRPVSFKDFGGLESVLEQIKDVIYPLYHPNLYPWLGIEPSHGILLHGPPGCGKTKLAHAIANETGVPFYKISATEVVSGISGESEEKIRALFDKAHKTAPSIIFIDEIDAISAKRESLQREMERRIVTQLLTCMDNLHFSAASLGKESDTEEVRNQNYGHVLVIGATNRPDALDPALRRPGRFDPEIFLGVPDENTRFDILSVVTRGLRLEGAFDFKKIARCTPGFVGADLKALAREAGKIAIKRIRARKSCEESLDPESSKSDEEESWKMPWTTDEMKNLNITMADFEEAIPKLQPSTRREGFSSIPNVKWEDVGALMCVRKAFEINVVGRIKEPELYEALGMDLHDGFLLFGPPGCGKTLVAKAVANEAAASFIHIKGPELLNKYVGESELAVRTIFNRARVCSPCIIFFDEIDALTTRRGTDGGWVIERLLNQLLIEMDGAESRKGIFVIGATNRPDVIDDALLRPGRLEKLLYVPLPDADGRISILNALTRKKPIAHDVNLHDIALHEACENFSGADLAALLREASLAALEDKATVVHSSHFKKAFQKVKPSLPRERYEAVFQKFMKSRGILLE